MQNVFAFCAHPNSHCIKMLIYLYLKLSEISSNNSNIKHNTQGLSEQANLNFEVVCPQYQHSFTHYTHTNKIQYLQITNTHVQSILYSCTYCTNSPWCTIPVYYNLYKLYLVQDTAVLFLNFITTLKH